VNHWPYWSFHRYVKQAWLPANWGSNIESLNGTDSANKLARTRALRSLLNSIAMYNLGAIALCLARRVAAFIFGLLVTGL
jgi:hypothetical protein